MTKLPIKKTTRLTGYDYNNVELYCKGGRSAAPTIKNNDRSKMILSKIIHAIIILRGGDGYYFT